MIIRVRLFLQSFLLGLLLFLWALGSGIFVKQITGISLGKQNSNNIEVDFGSFLLLVITGPIIETLIFQLLIIYQTYQSSKWVNKKYLAIFISTFFFALFHFYSIYYFISTIVSGLFLAICFCYFRDKTNWLSAAFYVYIIHAITNLIGFIMKVLHI